MTVLSICGARTPTGSCCPVTTTGGRCPTHAREDNDRRHRKQREHGRDTAHWRELVQLAYQRAGRECECGCGTPFVTGDNKRRPTVHLDPRLQGRHELATLEDVLVLTASCHGRLDAPRASTGGGSQRRRRPLPPRASLTRVSVTDRYPA